ncbi:RidA family protein [Thermoplasma sp.]|uniref:RidA family protein n=1 Tax=Thermoplasma sp. TaxID=1973142 RepID=UPI0012895919|nr:RidA family protein [Thermoplasma sp.]KAA8922009.1 MAG: RidA family protein [Thermoplasma sp.]
MASKKTIDVNGLTKGGPYSHAVISGNLVFVSGQTGNTPDKDTNFSEQFQNAISRIDEILKACGSGLQNILKVTVYLSDAGFFKEMNDLFAKYFPNNPPARTTVIAGFVSKGVYVELDVIAAL